MKGIGMGIFKTALDAKLKAREYGRAGNEWVAGDREALPQFPGAPVGLDVLLRFRSLSEKIARTGVEAPAVVVAIARGETLPSSGGVTATYQVTIAPSDGAPYPASITQPMMEAAFADISVGDAITVRYDPDEPTAAIIYSW
jgi:hypothetical protein